MLADLERAVKSRNDAWLKRILEKKPRLDNPEGGRILWLAVLDDEVEIASMLVRAGADLHVRKPGSALEETLLHILGGSLDPRHRRLALLMLDHGANVNNGDKRATSVLFRVLEAKHSDVNFVGELLLRGTRVDSEELYKATEHPLATELLPLMLEMGFVDVKTRRKHAEFALYFIACAVNELEDKTLAAMKSLFDMKLPLRKSNSMVVAALVLVVVSEKREVVRYLLDQGVDVNGKLLGGSTPIHSACEHASLEMMKLLVRRGADFNVVNDSDATPFSWIPDAGYLNDKCSFGIKHLALSTAKGRDMNVRDRTIIGNSAEMKKFYDGCLEELRMMRLTIVSNNVTFFDVLKSNVRRLSFMTRNSNFVKSFKGYPREQKFPIYCGELEEVFDNAESRKRRLLEKEMALREELVNVLPYVPLEKIVFFLYLNEEIDDKN